MFTHFERIPELICERLLIYVLKKNKDLTRFLGHQQHIETRKNLSSVDEIFIIEIPDICIQCKGKTNLMYNLLENSVKSSFGYL